MIRNSNTSGKDRSAPMSSTRVNTVNAISATSPTSISNSSEIFLTSKQSPVTPVVLTLASSSTHNTTTAQQNNAQQPKLSSPSTMSFASLHDRFQFGSTQQQNVTKKNLLQLQQQQSQQQRNPAKSTTNANSTINPAAITSSAAASMQSKTSADAFFKNKENLNNSLSKIFFNSPRANSNSEQPVTELTQADSNAPPQFQQQQQQQQQQQLSTSPSSSQKTSNSIGNFNPSAIKLGLGINSPPLRTNSAKQSSSNSQQSRVMTTSNSTVSLSTRKPANSVISTNNQQGKQSLVLTKNITLKENNRLNISSSSSTSNILNESVDIKKATTAGIHATPKSDKKLGLTRPLSSTHAEKTSFFLSKNQFSIAAASKPKEERSKISTSASKKNLNGSLRNNSYLQSSGIASRSNGNVVVTSNASETNNNNPSQRPSTKSRSSNDSVVITQAKKPQSSLDSDKFLKSFNNALIAAKQPSSTTIQNQPASIPIIEYSKVPEKVSQQSDETSSKNPAIEASTTQSPSPMSSSEQNTQRAAITNDSIKQIETLPAKVQSTTATTITTKAGLSSFITQVNQGSMIPLNFQKQQSTKAKSPVTNALQQRRQPGQNLLSTSNSQLSMRNFANAYGGSSYANNGSGTSKASSSQMQRNSMPVYSATSTNSMNSYKSFAFKSMSNQNSYQQQHLASKNSSAPQVQIINTASVEIEPTQSVSLKNSVLVSSQAHVQSVHDQNHHGGRHPKLYYISSIVGAYQNQNDQSTLAVLARDHLVQTIQSLQFSNLITVPSLAQIEEKKVYFPQMKEFKKTLIFDLDETLIHCNETVNVPSDVVLPIIFPTGEIIEAGINVRPYAVQILSELSKIYEIVIFTASHSCYANVVLDYLDPENKFISQRLFREHCVQTEEGVYVKDLRVIGNRNMNHMLLVDNAAYSFGFQIDNGIPIIPFYDDKSDQELKYLTTYMKGIQHVIDLKEVNRKLLKISSYLDYQDPFDLLEALYPEFILPQ